MKASELFDVTGLVTIVTGGGSGIGMGYAEAMADNGAVVTIFDRDQAAMEAAVEALTARGGSVQGRVADTTDKAGLSDAFAAVVDEHGRLDVVFANAGQGGGPGFLTPGGARFEGREFENLPGDQLAEVMAVNVQGTFNTVQLAAQYMRPRKSGRIIVTQSVSATKTETFVGTPYVISKGAVGQLVRQAAMELAAEGITVNAISPGPIVTNISGGRLKDPGVQAEVGKLIPLHRMGTPADLQGAALLLASPASGYMTGSNIIVDGAFSLGTAD